MWSVSEQINKIHLLSPNTWQPRCELATGLVYCDQCYCVWGCLLALSNTKRGATCKKFKVLLFFLLQPLLSFLWGLHVAAFSCPPCRVALLGFSCWRGPPFFNTALLRWRFLLCWVSWPKETKVTRSRCVVACQIRCRYQFKGQIALNITKNSPT